MRKGEMCFNSKNRAVTIYAVRWMPQEDEIRGVIQIVHGMAEHILRYEGLAEYFTARGFVVTGEDHLGHGDTANTEEEYGYFGTDPDATVVLVRDEHRLKKLTQKVYPDVPYFILGHSMGSFIVRKYISMYGTGIDGAIVVGTAWHSPESLLAGRGLTWLIGSLEGWKYRSRFLDRLVFGGYNKRIQNKKTDVDWLSREESNVQSYIEDPKCGFIFTVNGFQTLFRLVGQIQSHRNMEYIPKNLPIYLIAGEEDPVGHYGKDVKKVYEVYKELGIEDVSMKLYPNDRHELLNETDKLEVYADVCHWVEQHMSEK